MLTFFLYLMKSVLCLALFYPFYMVLLSRETFHRFNRMALISILLASVVIPACRITTEEPMLLSQLYQRWEYWLTGQEVETATAVIDADWGNMDFAAMPVAEDDLLEAAPSFSFGDFLSTHWDDLLFLLYVAGILFLIVRHIASLVRLFGLLRQGKMQRLDDGTLLYLHQQAGIAPFSWMKYIVISEADYRESGRQIVAHEQAHISNGHSWDLLLVELCLLAQWFNPAAWLLRQELQNIHEYEADDTVLRRGINAKEYQLLIIKKAVGARLYSLANSLNHSSLKKRLTMMMKEKSHPWARLKYLYVLPLAAISMVAFAHTEAANNSNGISEAKGTEVSANNQTSSVKYSENGASLSQDNHSNEKFTVHVDSKGQYSYGPMGGTLKKGTLDDIADYITKEREKLMAAGGGQYLAVNVKFDKNASKESVDRLKETLRKIWVLRINYAPMEQTKPDANYLNLKGTPRYNEKENHIEVDSAEEVFAVVENMPEFPGGTAEMMKFLQQNLKYPEQAWKDSIQGRVIVQFVISKTGKVTDPTIMRSVSPELDAEAIRVVNAMPLWTPGKQRGKPVNVKFTLPIQFKLTKASTKFTAMVNGQSIVVESRPTTKAQYPGGREAMLNFFQSRLKFDKSLSDKVEERVLLQAFISSEGKLIGYTDVTRKNHLETPNALIQEAHRVADLLPKEGWTPAVLNGKPVNGSVVIPVSFRFKEASKKIS